MTVVRAYMGKALQVQAEQQVIEAFADKWKKPVRKKFFHWKQPFTDIDVVINDGEGLDGRGPPKEAAFYGLNSTQVMCTQDDPEFSRAWEKKDSKNRSNTLPYRFREFYVPNTIDPEKETPKLAIQYIVAYKRV